MRAIRAALVLLLAWTYGAALVGCSESNADEAPPADEALPDVATDLALPDEGAPDEGMPDVDPNAYPIQALQDPSYPGRPSAGDPVVLADVVVTTPRFGGGFWVGEPEGGPWSGVWVFTGPVPGLPETAVGDRVRVEGEYGEFAGETQVVSHTLEVTGSGPPVEPTLVGAEQVCPGCEGAEAFEGVLVRLHDVQVVSEAVGGGAFAVVPVAGGSPVRVGAFLAALHSYVPRVGDAFGVLTGVLDSNLGALEVAPRGCADLLGPDDAPRCEGPRCPAGTVEVSRLKARFRDDAVPGGCRVRLEGVVASTVARIDSAGIRVLFAQAPEGGPWSGVALDVGEVRGVEVARGDLLTVDGTLDAQAERASVVVDGLRVDGATDPPAPETLAPGELTDTAELATAYDGVLVRVADVVTVATPSLDEGVDVGAFAVAAPDALDAAVVVEDALETGFACADGCDDDRRALHQRFDAVVGVLAWWGRYRIVPRDDADLSLRACAAPDADCDDVPAAEDVCPARFDPGQADRDEDGVGDACDVCADLPGAGDGDQDGDGVGDACDGCPDHPDPWQEDTDGDGEGDACDADADGDEVPDEVDVCPFAADPDQADADGDGVGDACAPRPRRIADAEPLPGARRVAGRQRGGDRAGCARRAGDAAGRGQRAPAVLRQRGGATQRGRPVGSQPARRARERTAPGGCADGLLR